MEDKAQPGANLSTGAAGAAEPLSAGLDEPRWFGMRFPTISLWQPYASLPLFGLKPWETRNRPYPAKYHGQRVCVASTKAYAPRIPEELDALIIDRIGSDYERLLPRGRVLYSIVLKGCERTEDGARKVPPELLCTGDFSPGRWMWEWGDVERFNHFPAKGGQGWWFCYVPDGAFQCATRSTLRPADASRSDGATPEGQPSPGMPSLIAQADAATQSRTPESPRSSV